MVLGLTGYYCSGKSTVEKIIAEEWGFLAIDVDRVGHEVLHEKRAEIARTFGETVLDSEGRVDRKALGKIVFAERERLAELNALLHPAMRESIRQTIEANRGRNICINAALLFEMELDSLCEAVLIVKIGLIETIRRGRRRDGHGIGRILQIISAQKVKELAKKNPYNVDIYSIGNSNIDITKKRVKKLMAKLNIT